jgi:hypothetical protein
MPLKRLVIFAEGHGEVLGIVGLVKRLVGEHDPWQYLIVDEAVIRAGPLGKFTGRNQAKWISLLGIAHKRSNLGGILCVLDGDPDAFEGQQFCAVTAAQVLSQRARDAGAGSVFSVATVFALKEYESWLICGVESLAGRKLPDGRPGIRSGVRPPTNPELAPRDAKGWLSDHMDGGSRYRPTLDQKHLTDMVDIHKIREQESKSFRRLEHAIAQIVGGIKTGSHVSTP